MTTSRTEFRSLRDLDRKFAAVQRAREEESQGSPCWFDWWWGLRNVGRVLRRSSCGGGRRSTAQGRDGSPHVRKGPGGADHRGPALSHAALSGRDLLLLPKRNPVRTTYLASRALRTSDLSPTVSLAKQTPTPWRAPGIGATSGYLTSSRGAPEQAFEA